MNFLSIFHNQNDLPKSSLHSETDFHDTFLKDLNNCKNEVIVESPYITTERMANLLPVFQRLLNKNIEIHIVTRDPADHENEVFRLQSTNEILKCIELGINVILLKGFHHRKISIIDRKILWEGSLNILSQTKSKEIMRRIDNKSESTKMFNFLSLKQYI